MHTWNCHNKFPRSSDWSYEVSDLSQGHLAKVGLNLTTKQSYRKVEIIVIFKISIDINKQYNKVNSSVQCNAWLCNSELRIIFKVRSAFVNPCAAYSVFANQNIFGNTHSQSSVKRVLYC